jgi:hypothetical protein
MSPEKRPLMFARILAEVARHGIHVDALAVGDGPELPRLRRAIRRYGLDQRVKVLGRLPPERVREALRAADVMLLPSALEGLSIALIEAMALGLVPVAARVGGQHELVTPESGFLIAHGKNEVAEYTAAIVRLALDGDLRVAMAEEARALVEQSFDLETLAKGVRLSVERALGVAAQRTWAADPRAAELAHAAVAQLAAQDALDARWIASNAHPFHRRLRQARQVMLPMGSSRYGIYKTLRERLREYSSGHGSDTNVSLVKR